MASVASPAEDEVTSERDEFITVRAACRILDVDATTVNLMVNRGVLTSKKYPTLPLRVSKADCERLVVESVRPATVGPAARRGALSE